MNDSASEPPERAVPRGGGGAGDPLEGEPLRFLVGVTASGKSALAVPLAERVGAEIVSVDSMLVYRGLDVGTAKPGAGERVRVPHHLLDRVDPDERYDVRRYLADVRAAVAGIRARGRRVLFVGGTGLYLKALTHGLFEGPPRDPALRRRLEERSRTEGPEALHAELAAVDPASARRVHARDVRRVVRALEVFRATGRPLGEWQREWRDPRSGSASAGRPRLLVGLAVEPARLDERVRERTAAMLEAGWVEEAAAVREDPGFGPTAAKALGYADVLRYADGEIGRAELCELVALRTRQFARRQRTWLRHFPEIHWIPAPDGREEREAALAAAVRHLRWEPGEWERAGG